MRTLLTVFLTIGVAVVLAPNFGCEAEPGPGPGPGPGPTTLTIVKTSIAMRFDAALRVGDDLIAFGTGVNTGVSYIVPSTAPTAGTPVTDSDNYDSSAFAVGGGTIFLAGSNTGPLAFQMSVFDVPTETLTTFTEGEIRLARIPASEEDAGNIQADGDLCAVVCDPNTVTDGRVLKVIDVSSGTPTLIAFTDNPASSGFGVAQVAVDNATRTVVAVADDTFHVYDVDNPTADAVEIPVPNGIGDEQIEISGNYIIAHDDQSSTEAFLVDLATSSLIALTDAQATGEMAVGATTFAFFANATADDSSGGSNRAAVGTVPGPGSTKAALDNFIDGSTTNNGLVGFAGSMSIVPDGSYVFLSDGYLQYSPGTAAFTVPADPAGQDPYATPALDVECSSNTVGFKTSTTKSDSSDATVGYIILP